jgi:uncharacterized membrane protein
VAANSIKRAACAATVLVWGLCWLTPTPEPLKIVVIIPLLLLLPGLVVIRGALRKKAMNFEFLILAIGMSVALTIVLGLVLHGLNALNSGGWGAAISALLAVAIWRWLFAKDASRKEERLSPFAVAGNRRLAACSGVAAALFAGSIALAHYGADNHRQFAYSELWMVPSEGADSNTISVGVRNDEQKATNYDLEVLVDNKVFVRWPEFRLENDEQWTRELPIPLAIRHSRHVEARLYNRDQPLRIYRRVWLSRDEVASQ